MGRYPDEQTARFDQQFAETPAERSERIRETRLRKSIESLQRLVADMSDDLRDEGNDYSVEGLIAMRRRVANALPPDKCPDWLAQYRDPAVTAGVP